MITNKKAFEMSTWMKSDEFKALRFTVPGNLKIHANVKALEEFVKFLEGVETQYRTPSEEIQKIEDLRIELVKPYCTLNEEGKVQVDQNSHLILKNEEDEPTVSKMLSEFMSQHSLVFMEYQTAIQEWEIYFQTKEAADLTFKTLDLSEARIDDAVLSTEGFEMLTILIPELVPAEVKAEVKEEPAEVIQLSEAKPVPRRGKPPTKKRKAKAQPAKSVKE